MQDLITKRGWYLMSSSHTFPEFWSWVILQWSPEISLLAGNERSHPTNKRSQWGRIEQHVTAKIHMQIKWTLFAFQNNIPGWFIDACRFEEKHNRPFQSLHSSAIASHLKRLHELLSSTWPLRIFLSFFSINKTKW